MQKNTYNSYNMGKLRAGMLDAFGGEKQLFDLLSFLPKKIVWLSGAPGAGKGTNEKYIIDYGNLYHEPLIASSLLTKPELLEKINKGLLLDDNTVVSAVFKELSKSFYRQGVLVDGFPRTPGQAEAVAWLYEQMLQRKIDAKFYIILFMLDETESINRQLHRGQLDLEHNEEVKRTGVGELVEIRATDLDSSIAKQRYSQFVDITYNGLLSLKTCMPFAEIDTNCNFETVKERLMNELKRLNI